MVKPMPAIEAGKIAIGDVGDGTSVGDELDSASAHCRVCSVWDGVVRLPVMRLPMRR